MAGLSSFKLVLTGFLLFTASVTSHVEARTPVAAESAAAISVAELPAQGAETYALIARGGPFPNEKDGVVFGNRERIHSGAGPAGGQTLSRRRDLALEARGMSR